MSSCKAPTPATGPRRPDLATGRIGNAALAHQYQVIANALHEIASQSAFGCPSTTPESQEAFRIGVVFVSTEVLDSYREDLLNPNCSDKYLLIEREFNSKKQSILSAAGILAASMLGLVLAVQGLGVFPAWLTTVALAAPFALYWVEAPRRALRRRYAFASIIGAEIARRKGAQPPSEAPNSGRPLIRHLFVAEGTAFNLTAACRLTTGDLNAVQAAGFQVAGFQAAETQVTGFQVTGFQVTGFQVTGTQVDGHPGRLHRLTIGRGRFRPTRESLTHERRTFARGPVETSPFETTCPVGAQLERRSWTNFEAWPYFAGRSYFGGQAFLDARACAVA